MTLIGGYVAALLHAAAARGVDMDWLLREAGLERIPANDPMVRVPLSAFTRLTEAAVEATDDPYFGLYAANFLHAANLHALGLSLLASANVQDFCLRLCRYYRFLTGTARPAFVIHPDDAQLKFVMTTPTPPVSREAFGVFVVRTIGELSDGAVKATLVELSQPPPPDGGLHHAQAFGCPVRFDVPSSIIHFDPSQIDVPFEGASRELAEHNERIVVTYLARLDRSDVVSRVRSILMQDLPTGALTKETVARKLAMSPRTLQIKLAKSDTSFQEIVDETRYALACGYMDNGALSITEVAYLLGFSDTSNFSRAFRRWSGHSPSQHRIGGRAANGTRIAS
jgi:AraC-like DNA-binding protein